MRRKIMDIGIKEYVNLANITLLNTWFIKIIPKGCHKGFLNNKNNF